jgi:hypothetical protein
MPLHESVDLTATRPGCGSAEPLSPQAPSTTADRLRDALHAGLVIVMGARDTFAFAASRTVIAAADNK